MLRGGDIELLGTGISEWMGLSQERSYEAEAAATIVADCFFMWHKLLRSKFEKPGR